MENVILVIHLILAVSLIGIVLLQRSEGGGLGLGGGGGGGGVMSGRAAASALAKLTWILAIAFFITSLTMTVMAARKSAEQSVLDRLGEETPPASTAPASEAPAPPIPAPAGDSLLPPSAGGSDAGAATPAVPAIPPAVPATPPPPAGGN